MTTALHPDVALAQTIFRALLDRHLPGRVVALHIVGSAVLGDYRPGRSDLDFVAVLAAALDNGELEALGIVHRLYAADPTLPPLNGIWITGADLAAGPDAAPDGPFSQDNRLALAGRGNRNPVTWAELRGAGVEVSHDPGRLDEWLRGNVESYWVPWHVRASRRPGMLGRSLPAWGVLGMARIYTTVTSGRIVGKSEAGQLALDAFPAHRRVIEDALRYRSRHSSLYVNPLRRRREALAFVANVIAAIRAPGAAGNVSPSR